MKSMDINNAVQEVIDGTADPMEVYAYLHKMGKVIETAKNEIFEYALKEAQKFEDKTFQYKGFEFQVSEGRKVYDFKHIPEWGDLKAKLTEIEERAKAAALNSSKGLITASNEGEEITPCVIKFSKPSLTIKEVR